MLLPISKSISKSRRQCLPWILWSGILFALSGRCAADAVDFSTSEILVVGTPARNDLTTRTVTVTIAYKPTLVSGVSPHALSGCYGHTGVDQRGGHPFGTEQDYATPSSVDPAKLTVVSCLDACAALPRQPSSKEGFAFAGVKNGSECYCFLKLDKNAVKLSANDCTTACPGDPKLSCGGPDALAVYSLGAANEAAKSTASSTGTSHHASHTGPVKSAASHPPSHDSSPPPPAPSEVKVGGGGGDGGSDSGGQSSSGTPKATTVAAISGSMSGAIVLSVIIYFCFRAYKRRRREQDAHVAGMLTKASSSSAHTLADPCRSPSRGRTRTRAFVPPRLTGLYHTPGLEGGGEGRRGRARAAFLAAMRGPISAPLLPPPPPMLSTTDLPPSPARGPDEAEDGGHSSAVRWRPAGSSPASPANPAATAQPASLGDRAWHRRRLSTPYAPPTIPLPPTPPPVRQKKLAAAAAAAAGQTTPVPPGPGVRDLTTAPLRPGRKGTAAPFETGSPVRRRLSGGQADAAAPAAAAAPPPHLEFLPSTRYLGDREPTIPVLPPIAAGERMELGSGAWRAGGDDDASPTTTVGTDILYD